MIRRNEQTKRLFVIDTNVLMHDPSSIYRFEEHDIYIPMVVLEELDNNKKGLSEVARNVRQVSRYFDAILAHAKGDEIKVGLSLNHFSKKPNGQPPHGRLYFQNHELTAKLPHSLPGNKPDNSILETILALQVERPELDVILVSKDINLRIKATLLGISAEDYFNDKVIDDIELLHKGMIFLADDFWESHGKNMKSWKDKEKTFYRLTGDDVHEWYPNMFLATKEEEGFSGVVREIQEKEALIELVVDYRHANNAVWGVVARNREQNFALNLLMDPNIDFVSLQGIAGTGKTLLALAAGLAQTIEKKRYREIIVTRTTVPLGEDIGFLPGTEEEKMTPWMGALMDNLEVLHCHEDSETWEKDATNDLLRNRIKIRSMNFMRGRTFLNKYIIIDEAQNLSSKQIKTLITRAGPGTKIVCLGDIKQIDTPYLTETNSGFTYAVDRFRSWEHSGHITLIRGERSRLADFAAEEL
ncbi:MAG: PhoH family protein [Gammaproteobacteria bacterium]|nr:PhoH family protein [Gammaproteobacteria bacterium]